MKRYNLTSIMVHAWKIFRAGCESFALALHKSWEAAKANREAVKAAAKEAGVTEPVRTWYGWKAAGYMVNHGSTALFKVLSDAPEKGDGKKVVKSFFGLSQVSPA